MASLFSKIITGEIPCHKIAEDDQFLAFLDIFPLVPGHTLVIPKQEVDYFFDMDAMALSQIMVFARPIAKAIEKAIPCKRIGITVIGLEVPHAHVHLIPINSVTDMNFERPKLKPTGEELANTANLIRAEF